MPNETNINIAAYLKALNILYFALIAGLCIFVLIAIVLVSNSWMDNSMYDIKNILESMALVIAIVCLFAGITLFNKRIAAIDPNAELSDKLNTYRAAVILRAALLDGAGIFSVMTYLLTGDMRVLAITAVVLLFFVTLRPTKAALVKALSLSSQETMMMEDEKV